MGVLDGLGVDLPQIGSVGFSGAILMNFVWFMLFLALVGVGGFFFWNNMVYKFKIEVFENLGGTRYVKTGTDRARLIRLGDGGETILKLKKRKTYQTAYGKKMGANLFWFAVGQDGYWYNITLGDLDAKQGMLDIEPIDRDMRYMHVAIRKNISDRYHKINFMDKYGSWIMGGIVILVVLLGFWFLIDQMGDLAQTMSGSQQTAYEVMKGNQEVLSSLNNLLQNSGIRKV